MRTEELRVSKYKMCPNLVSEENWERVVYNFHESMKLIRIIFSSYNNSAYRVKKLQVEIFVVKVFV